MRRKGGKKGKAARNARAKEPADGKEEAYSKAPHSFVFHRGHVGKTVKELVTDIRKVMEPYTASNLKVRKRNVMKDFLTMAGPLHVSHFIVFTKTDIATYMKLICVPRGPTLTFKVNEFSLARDVLSFQKHPDVEAKLFANHAVMVTNLPTDSMENKLMNVTFKNMFPSINPNTVKLNSMRRSVLVNYDAESKVIDIRHYTMKVTPTGVSRAMKKLMKSTIPDLGHHEDIADLFMEKGHSDSEGEQDGPHNQVTVTQKVKDRGVTRNAVNAIRLKEIGPRLSLQLIKIEEGFEGGNVLYHALVQKTPEEVETLKLIRQNKQKEKLARKQRQEASVRKKQEAKEEHIRKTLEGMKKKKKEEGKESGSEEEEKEEKPKVKRKEVDGDEDSDDDIEYYKKEVGVEPEPEMFSRTKKRKRSTEDEGPRAAKQQRVNRDRPMKKGEKKSKFSVKISQKGNKGGKRNSQKNFKAGQSRVKQPKVKPGKMKRKK